MMPDLSTLISQAWASVSTPREVARWVMHFDLPRLMRWQVLLLVVVLSTVLPFLQVQLVGSPSQVVMGEVMARPFTAGLVQMCALVVTVFMIFWIGRAMGGQGDMGDAILLVAWLIFVLFLLGVVQLVMLFLIPPIAILISLLSIGLFFWLLTNFIAELHGFASLAQVFMMILVSLLGFAFGLSLILSMIGLSVTGVPANV